MSEEQFYHEVMREMEMQSAEINELAEALAKAQGAIKNAIKSSDNPYFKSKYADLAAVIDVCREALSSNAIAVVQSPGRDQHGMVLYTTLMHKSGQWIKGVYPIMPTKQDPQGFGSALTYARRYSLAPMVGIAQEDDDGNAASQEPVKTAKVILTAKQKKDTFEQVVSCLSANDAFGLKEIMDGFDQDEKVELWKLFNSQQKTAIKSMMAEV